MLPLHTPRIYPDVQTNVRKKKEKGKECQYYRLLTNTVGMLSVQKTNKW